MASTVGVQVRGLPLRDATARIARWYVLLTDIDERKRAEDALRASERNLKLIIDTIPALAWSARPDGSAEFFNQHYLDFMGLSAEQASGWGWTAAVHPDDLNGLAATWQRIMASEAPEKPKRDCAGMTASIGGFSSARTRCATNPGPSSSGTGPARTSTTGSGPKTSCGAVRRSLAEGHASQLDRHLRTGDRDTRRDRVVGGALPHPGVGSRAATADADDALFERIDASGRRGPAAYALPTQRLSKTGSFITDLLADDHNWSEEAFRIFEFDPATKVTLQSDSGHRPPRGPAVVRRRDHARHGRASDVDLASASSPRREP